MDFLVRGVIRSFLYMLKYQLDSHLAADPIMSSQQYLALNDLYMCILCFLDDDPMTSGYIDFVTPTQRELMIEWRILRMSTHTVNPRTGVSTRNRQMGRLHVFSSEMQAEVQDIPEDHTELSAPSPGTFPHGENLDENTIEISVCQLRPVPHRTGIVQVHYQTLVDPLLHTPDLSMGATDPPRAQGVPALTPPRPPALRQSSRVRTPNLSPKPH